MSLKRWMNYIESADKSSIISGKTRKIFYKFKDSAEMIEEYNIETGILIRRAWKRKHNLLSAHTSSFDGSAFDWDVELGDVFPSTQDSSLFLTESNTMVI